MRESGSVPEGTILADKFRVVGVLGAGAMGVVYEVEHALTRHRRALKVLHPEMLSRAPVVARFLREASAAGHIGNAHIAETFDAGRLATGEPYIVMELLHGETLAEKRDREKCLSLEDLVEIAGQACDGVQAAHEAGIVHRDLKPENLFLLGSASPPFVKILDFGVSKFDSALTGGNLVTREGAPLGTPYYMSPEQVLGEPGIDGRSDIYALGVILYECAGGERPFEADSFPVLCTRIHEARPRSLAELRPDLPPSFVSLVHRAMAKERAARFETARALGAALGAFGAISHLGAKAGFTSAPPRKSARAPALRAAGSSFLSSSGAPSRVTRSTLLLAGGIALVAGGAITLSATWGSRAVTPMTKEPARHASEPPVSDGSVFQTPESVVSLTPESTPSAPPAFTQEAVSRPPDRLDPQSAPRTKTKTHVDQVGLARDNPYAP